MPRRLTLAVALTLAATASSFASGSSAAPFAQQPSPSGIQTSIDGLGAFEYATRLNAARTIRRIPAPRAVPALIDAARSHADQFVRYRALVLLTAFEDRSTPGLMRSLLPDRNDRVREVAYRWFARHPEPGMVATLLGALQTEQAEFVRPALVSALAALDMEPQVQRALVTEAGRGLDFFRIAVIEALGERRTPYAADAIAPVATIEGPLQDDAVLALARMGDARALAVDTAGATPSPDLAVMLHAARCLLGDACEVEVKALVDMVATPRVAAQSARAALTALTAIAGKPDMAATTALVHLAGAAPAGLRDEAAVAFSVVAVRVPGHVLEWLAAAPDAVTRDAAMTMLRTGFERLEEDFAEEQFFAAARGAYWAAAEGSAQRTQIAALIERLEF